MQRPPFVSVNIRSSRPGGRVGRSDIVEAFVAAIEAGQLRPGMRLAPVRALEHQLGISKNTAQAAYDELVARGLLESRARAGVFVAGEGSTPSTARIGPAVKAAAPAEFDTPKLAPPAMPDKQRVELSSVFIDPSLLPKKRLADCVRSVLHSPGLQPFYDAQGHPGLRRAIAERLAARGMEAEPDDIILTTGSQQALDLVARSLKQRRIAM